MTIIENMYMSYLESYSEENYNEIGRHLKKVTKYENIVPLKVGIIVRP